MVPRAPLFFLVLWFTSLLAGQSPARRADYHLQEDEARRLYALSTFAHGHRHGYEAGYRAADEEIHLGALQRELRDKDIPKDMEYRSEYGDKRQFREGFLYGFRAGYQDSYAERTFRLPAWTNAVPPLGSELPQAEAPVIANPQVKRQFDRGVARGYRAAQQVETDETDAPTLARKAGQVCRAETDAVHVGFCDGFVQGFLVGANDRLALGDSPRQAAVGHVP